MLLRDRYVLERQIEDEPVARTYLARDLVVDRLLAVTVLQDHVAARRGAIERFLDMERRAGALFHPHLVTIFDAGATDGLCWSAHEYCGGGLLLHRLPSRQPIPAWQVVSLLSQIGAALEVLHLHGLVYGRLTPDSVRFDEAGGAKLGGVGVASVAELLGVSASGADSGLQAYLAPEQREDVDANERADQYSLALIGAELLVGSWHLPELAVAERHPEELIGYLRTARPDVPASVMAALGRALDADPARRFNSVGDFVLALSGTVIEPAVVAQPMEKTAHQEAPNAPRGRAARTSMPASDQTPTQPWSRPPEQAVSSGNSVVFGHARPRASALAGGVAAHGSRGIRAARSSSARLGAYAAPRVASNLRAVHSWYLARHPADRLLLAGSVVALVFAAMLIVPTILNPPPAVAVPGMEGALVDAARSAAAGSGLQVSERQETSTSVPAGQVIRQDPPPGQILRADRPVHLVVSSGPPPVPVPNILRRDVESARQELASVGLSLGTVYEYDTNRQAWGTITAQSVKTGREVSPGSAIDVAIATPPWTSVPRLIDRELGDVEKDLDGRGLSLGAVQLRPMDGVRAGTVIAQDPEPDSSVRQGNRVGVVIAVPAVAERGGE